MNARRNIMAVFQVSFWIFGFSLLTIGASQGYTHCPYDYLAVDGKCYCLLDDDTSKANHHFGYFYASINSVDSMV